MAVTLTRNLKLRINDNLTADAKYNLSRLDLLGSSFLVDSTNTLNIRSQTDIRIEPEAADIEGSGTGGTVSIGTSSHSLEAINLFADQVNVSGPLAIKDQGLLGDKSLLLVYKSDLEGTTDTTADRTLQVDLEGANRDLVLGGSLGILGGDLFLTLTANTALTLPEEGTLSTLDGLEILTNKTIDATLNTITNINYDNLDLTDSIVNSDIATNAAIAYSKLNLSGSVQASDLSPLFVIDYSSLDLDNSIVDSDISTSAAIQYSKLDLEDSIIASDISPSAGIPYSKLDLSDSILSSDLDPSFELQYSQLDLSDSIQSSDLVSGVLNDLLPDQAGQAGKVLSTNGTDPEWIVVSGTGSVTSVGLTAPASLFSVSGSPVTTSGTLDLSLTTKSSGLVFSGPATGPDASPTFRALVATDIPTLPYSKVAILDGDLTIAKTSGLQTALNSITTDVSGLQSDLTAAESDIATLQTDLGAAETDITALQSDVATAQSDIAALQAATLPSFKANWTTGDGDTITLNHLLGSTDVIIQVLDTVTGETIEVDSVVRDDIDNVTLTASVAPVNTWRVLILAV